MTTAQVVEKSVTVNNNSPIQDYVHPEDQTQPTFEITWMLLKKKKKKKGEQCSDYLLYQVPATCGRILWGP